MNYYSTKFEITEDNNLKSFFKNDNAEISPIQNAIWRARTSKYTATFYKTGKLLIQGSDVSEIAKRLEMYTGKENKPIPSQNTENNSSAVNLPTKHIGTDESGKGDFFGPLVIAAVLVTEDTADLLIKAGIKDCKKIEDKNINKLAAVIKNNCVFSVVTINPPKYNELYSKLKNLNLLLAWGHARAIENVLEKEECECALSDKFGDEKLIKNALLKKGKSIRLEQRCKAESDIAVAAASILAREQFLSGIKEISTKYNTDIPKGCSTNVMETAKAIAAKYTKDELKNIAKTHFKTYSQI